ncbi:hypothetical protein HK104_003070, partial [Borealophlyctis nickersoniae]
VTEKIYTALVALGADPLPPNADNAGILNWSLVEGHLNVTRAIAAAGVDILRTFGFFEFEEGYPDLVWYPDFCSVVYLVEECGLQNFDWLLSDGIIRGQTKCVQFLLTSGADMRSVNRWVVHLAAQRGHFEVLELLLDMGLEAFPGATYALSAVFRSSFIRDKDALPTVKVLIRGGANISASYLDVDVFLSERSDVVDFLFGAEELVSKFGKDYDLIQGVWRGDQTRVWGHIEAGADVNAFEGVALCLAVVKCKEDLVKLLLDCGANANEMVLNLALNLAIVKGKEDTVKLLLECGADPRGTIWQAVSFIRAQKKGVAQPSSANLSLLRDAVANSEYLIQKVYEARGRRGMAGMGNSCQNAGEDEWEE